MPWIVRKDDPVAARGLSGRTTQLNGRTSSPAPSTAHTPLCKVKLQLQFLRKSFFWTILLCSGPTLTSIPRALNLFMSLGDNGCSYCIPHAFTSLILKTTLGSRHHFHPPLRRLGDLRAPAVTRCNATWPVFTRKFKKNPSDLQGKYSQS